MHVMCPLARSPDACTCQAWAGLRPRARSPAGVAGIWLTGPPLLFPRMCIADVPLQTQNCNLTFTLIWDLDSLAIGAKPLCQIPTPLSLANFICDIYFLFIEPIDKAATCHSSIPYGSQLLHFRSSSLLMQLEDRIMEDGPVLGPCHPHGRAGWSSWFRALSWGSPGHCSHWRGEPADERYVYLSVPTSIPVTPTFKWINHQKRARKSA